MLFDVVVPNNCDDEFLQTPSCQDQYLQEIPSSHFTRLILKAHLAIG